MTKTKSQKARAKAAAKAGAPRRQAPQAQGGRRKKWYVDASTPWGDLKAGSGEPRRRNLQRSAQIGGNIGIGEYNSVVDPIVSFFEQDELITTINGNTTFSSVGYPVQPGNTTTFPWLAPIAARYQKYRFKYLEFYYKPTTTVGAQTGEQGKIILSMDLDAAAVTLSSAAEAMVLIPHTDALVVQNAYLNVDAKVLSDRNGKFVRSGILPAGTDIKTYDCGRLFVSVSGTYDTNQIGELHCRYGVDLINPLLEPIAAPPNFKAYRAHVPNAAIASNTLTTMIPNDPAELNGLEVANNGGVLTVHPGTYQVFANIKAYGSGAVITRFQLVISLDASVQTYSNYDRTDSAAQQIDTMFVSDVLTLNATTALAIQATVTFASGTASTDGLIHLIAI